jgi:hypothetical protein
MCRANQNRKGRAMSSYLLSQRSLRDCSIRAGTEARRCHIESSPRNGVDSIAEAVNGRRWCDLMRHRCAAACDSKRVETRHRRRASDVARHVHHQPPIQNMVAKSKEDRCVSPHSGLWGCLEHLNQIVQRVIERAATRKRTDGGVMEPTEPRASTVERSLVKGDR